MSKEHLIVPLIGLLLTVAAGCRPKPREISSLDRKQAANLVSEAEFAATLKDYARAEGLYAQAAELCPDNPDYLLGLGICQRRLDHRAEAKKAYEGALDALGSAYALDTHDVGPLLQQVYVLALLGRSEEARTTLQRARKEHGGDPRVQGMNDGALARMLSDPGFRALAL